jgi:hypothetical protein
MATGQITTVNVAIPPVKERQRTARRDYRGLQVFIVSPLPLWGVPVVTAAKTTDMPEPDLNLPAPARQ